MSMHICGNCGMLPQNKVFVLIKLHIILTGIIILHAIYKFVGNTPCILKECLVHKASVLEIRK